MSMEDYLIVRGVFFYFAKKRICINFGIFPFRMLLINLTSDIKKNNILIFNV